MAQWKYKRGHQTDKGDNKDNGNKNHGNNNGNKNHTNNTNNDKNKGNSNNGGKNEENVLRVPSNDNRVKPGNMVVLGGGGDKTGMINGVSRVSLPVTRNIDIDLVEVLVTEGPYKGAVVYHPYPSGADVRLFKTPEMKREMKREAIKTTLRGWFNTATLGYFEKN